MHIEIHISGQLPENVTKFLDNMVGFIVDSLVTVFGIDPSRITSAEFGPDAH
jgi:chemotaxis signal transduction protein